MKFKTNCKRSMEESLHRRDLIAKAKDGDKAAFAEYYKLNEKFIYKVYNKYVRNVRPSDANDLMQECILGFIVGTEKFNLPSEITENFSPESYIYCWVVNFAQEFVRKNYARKINLPMARLRIEDETVEGTDLLEYVEGKSENQEETSMLNELHSFLNKFERSIKNKRNKEIYRERIRNLEPPTLESMSTKFNVSRQRIAELEKQLRGKLTEFLLKEYLEAA
ncbi:MAG: sigma-70 family RNA polymerase sigma factor [Elusimicrobia bacterium]|nr:sigma-70 family RNA polymerase sigma factor [Elusimicrobiota bacterium]